MRAEINEIETKKGYREYLGSLKKINKIDKSLANLTKTRRGKDPPHVVKSDLKL
jgi:hypothetical protein